MQPYSHERHRPIPLYLRQVGVRDFPAATSVRLFVAGFPLTKRRR